MKDEKTGQSAPKFTQSNPALEGQRKMSPRKRLQLIEERMRANRVRLTEMAELLGVTVPDFQQRILNLETWAVDLDLLQYAIDAVVQSRVESEQARVACLMRFKEDYAEKLSTFRERK